MPFRLGIAGCAGNEQVSWGELALWRRGRLFLGSMADHHGSLYTRGRLRQGGHAKPQHVLHRRGEVYLRVALPGDFLIVRACSAPRSKLLRFGCVHPSQLQRVWCSLSQRRRLSDALASFYLSGVDKYVIASTFRRNRPVCMTTTAHSSSVVHPIVLPKVTPQSGFKRYQLDKLAFTREPDPRVLSYAQRRKLGDSVKSDETPKRLRGAYSEVR